MHPPFYPFGRIPRQLLTCPSDTPGGYHGYWAKDLYEVNENYGTADDLKSFVNAAHEKV